MPFSTLYQFPVFAHLTVGHSIGIFLNVVLTGSGNQMRESTAHKGWSPRRCPPPTNMFGHFMQFTWVGLTAGLWRQHMRWTFCRSELKLVRSKTVDTRVQHFMAKDCLLYQSCVLVAELLRERRHCSRREIRTHYSMFVWRLITAVP